MICSLLSNLRLILVILILITSSFSQSQTFSISGISGISFNESGSDYSISVTDDFTAYGIQVSPVNVTLNYATDTNTFSLTGSVENQFDGNTISSDLNLTIQNKVVQSLSYTVSADFDLKGLTFSPKDFTFAYDISNSEYEMYGTAKVNESSNQIDVALGDENTPGIIISNGIIQQISASVTTDLKLGGLTISPDNLSLFYSNSNSQYLMYGGVTASLADSSLELDLGDLSNPGLEIDNGTINTISATVTSDFTLKGMSFTSDGLAFNYDSQTDGGTFSMYGSSQITFDGEAIDVGLGSDESSAGLLYANGTIQQIELDISADFSLKGLSLSPQNFGFVFNNATDQFELFGTLDSELESNSISLNLGDESDPGGIISGGVIQQLHMTVQDKFNYKDIEFTAKDLSFNYNKQDDSFKMFGDVELIFDSETISATLGDESSPGLSMINGVVQSLSMGISADFKMKSLTIKPTDLTFEYNKSEATYQMFGDIKVDVDSVEIEMSLGNSDNPGLEVENGVVKDINMGVTSHFKYEHMNFKTKDLTLVYNHDEKIYEMYGILDLEFDKETLEANLGDDTEPGFKIKNGKVESIDIGVTADFKMKDLEIKPTDLTFIYKKSAAKYEMYGDIKFKVGSDEVEANLGDASDPGMIFQSNKIKHINIGVTTTFKISGLKIKATDVGVDWSKEKYFHLYGDADLSIANEDIDADFGTFHDPGVVIKEGKLHSLEVDINSDLKLGNLEVETKDLDVKYHNRKFEVTGKMEVKEVFSLAVTLGSGKQAGLEIDVSGSEPKFKIEDLTIDIEHANLGAIDLKQLKLEFNDDGIKESDVKVVFPEGWEVDATMKFKDVHGKAKLDEIDIAYNANNISDAIEIFEGVQLTHLEGDVSNLTRPSNLEVKAKIGTIYGGGFTLDHKSATFLEMSDEVTISKKEFKISGSVNVGAYRSGSNSWHALLGSGSIDLTAYFGHYIRARVNAKYPGDPLIEADLTAYLDNHGHFDGLLDVAFWVPKGVPFIGGKKYGSIDGAVRYKKGDLNNSFGAAWVRVHTFWHTYHPGAKYTFGSRHISIIGNSTVDWINRVINDDQNKGGKTSNNSNYVYSFDLPNPAPTSVLVSIDWESEVDEALITVIGPEGNYELLKAIDTNNGLSADKSLTLDYEENMTVVKKDTVTNFFFASPSGMNLNEKVRSNLVDGKYHVVVSFPNSESVIDTIQVQSIWQQPESTINVEKIDNNDFSLKVDYWSSLPDSTLISFYVNDVNSYEEARLINHVSATNFNEFGYGSETLEFNPTNIYDSTSELYFFAVIEDGVNPPFRSEISNSVSHEPDLKGIITLDDTITDLDVAGLRVFIDLNNNKNFDTESTGGLELFSLTNEDGFYSFPNLNSGSYNMRIVLPEGYRIAGEVDNTSSVIYTYNNQPIELNIQIEKY